LDEHVINFLPIQYATIEQELAMHKPENMSFEEAAAIPETWFTAYQALFFVGELKKGQDVMIHAGASGVGIAAIQLAKIYGA
jgi:tumor protein p53-inducible protein 3